MAKWFDLSRYGLSVWLDKADQPSFMRIQTILPYQSISDCIDIERLQSVFDRAGVRSEVSELGAVTALDISLVNGVPDSRWWAEAFPNMVLRDMSDMAVSPILEAPQVNGYRAQFFWEVVTGLDKEVHSALSRVFFDRRGAEQFSQDNKGQVFALKDEVFSLEWIADLREHGAGSYVMPAEAYAALSVDDQARILAATAPVPPAPVSDPLATVAATLSDSDEARLRDALVERSSVLQGATLDLRALGADRDEVMWLQINAGNGQVADLASMTGIDPSIVSEWLNQHSDKLPLDPALHTATEEWPKELDRFSFVDDAKRMLADLGVPFDWMVAIKHDHVRAIESYSPWESILNLRAKARQSDLALVMDDDSEGVIHAVSTETGEDTGLSIDWGADGKVKIYVNGVPVPNSVFTEDHESQRAYFDQAVEQVKSLAEGIDLWSAEASQDEAYDPVIAIDGVLMARAVVSDELAGVFEDRLNDPRWLVMNAARPLTGTETQEGPFLAGRYYALLDLEEDGVAVAIQMNHDLDARAVIPVTQAEMRQMAINTFGAKYKDRLHEFEPDIIEAQITHWVSQMHDRSYSDYQSLLAQARADIAEMNSKTLEAPADRFEGDMRGMAYAITDSQGRVATTGTVPTLISADEEFAHVVYYQQLAKAHAGQLWVAPMSNVTFPDEHDQPLFFGLTWEQLSARQQGENAPGIPNGQIPEGAVMVFDSAASARPEEAEDESQGDVEEDSNGTDVDSTDASAETDEVPADATESTEQSNIPIWSVPQAPSLTEFGVMVEGARTISNKGYRGNPDIKLRKLSDGARLATFKGVRLGVFEGRPSKKVILNAISDRNFELQSDIYAYLFARMQNEVARPMGFQIEVGGIQDPAQLAHKVARHWDLLPDVSLNDALKLSDRLTVNFDIRMRLDEVSIRVGVREKIDETHWRVRDAGWKPGSVSYGDALRSIPEQMLSLAESADTDHEIGRLLREAAYKIVIEDDAEVVAGQSDTDQQALTSLPLLRQFARSTHEGELAVAVAAASLLKEPSFKKNQRDALQAALYGPESEESLRALSQDDGLSHDEIKSKLLALAGIEQVDATAEPPKPEETGKGDTPRDSGDLQSEDVRRDYGEFIPGARKHQYGHDWHMWSDRQLVNVERFMFGGRELTSSDRAAARTMARKVKLSQFWPEPTFDQMLQAGNSVAAAVYKQMVRERMPNDTNAIVAGNSRDGRYMAPRQWLILGAAFAERTESVKERIDQIRTNADVVNEFIDHTGLESPFNDVRRNLLDDDIHQFSSYHEDLTSTERLIARMAEHREAALLAPSVAALARNTRYVKTPSPEDFVEALLNRVNTVVAAYSELSDEQRSAASELQDALSRLLLQHKDDSWRTFAEYRNGNHSYDEYKESRAELGTGLIRSAIECLDNRFAESPLFGSLLLSSSLYIDDVLRVLDAADPNAEAEANSGASTHLNEDQNDTPAEQDDQPEATIPPEESAILQVPSRKKPAPRFKNLRRTGELVRDGDVTEEMVAKTFGLRGIQYGEWVSDRERQAMLNMSYDSFADLAHALAVPPEFIGFNGRLALALGARGRGGKASAHFEPGENVINLTKTMGAGTLFHEYSHALDFFLKQYASEHTAPQHTFQLGSGAYLTNGLDKSVMDNRQAPLPAAKGETPVIHPVMWNLVRDLVNGNDEANSAELMKQRVAADAIERALIGPLMSKKTLEEVVIRYSHLRSEERAKSEFPDDEQARMARAKALLPACEREGYRIANNWRKTIKPYTDDLARRAALSEKGEVSDAFLRTLFQSPSGNGKRWMFQGGEHVHEYMNSILSDKGVTLSESEDKFAEIWTQQIDYSRHARKVFKAVLNDVGGYDGKQSKFMRDAMALDGNSKKLYWSNTQEIWARGFSAILHDRLNKQGVVNDFASRYSAPNLFNGEGFVASSNPEGEERDWFYLRAVPFFSALQKVAHEVCPGSEISEHVVSEDDVRAFVQDALRQIEGSIQRFIDGNESYADVRNPHTKIAIESFIELYGDVFPSVKPLFAEWAIRLSYPDMSEDEGLSSVEEDLRPSRYEHRKKEFDHWVQFEVYPALLNSGVLSVDAIAQQLRDSGNESQMLEYWFKNDVPELLPDVIAVFERRLEGVLHRLSVSNDEDDQQAELKNAAYRVQALGCNLFGRIHESEKMGQGQIQTIIRGIMDVTIEGGLSPFEIFHAFDAVKAQQIPPQQIERLAESIFTEDYDKCDFYDAHHFVEWLAEKRGWDGHNITPDMACRYLIAHPDGQHPSKAVQLALLPGTDTDALIMHAVESLDTALDVESVEHLFDRLEQRGLQIKESTLDFLISKLDPLVQDHVKKQGEAYLVGEKADEMCPAGSASTEMRM